MENMENQRLRQNWKRSRDNAVDATFFVDFAGRDLTKANQRAGAQSEWGAEGY
jgi:hypothetical protein